MAKLTGRPPLNPKAPKTVHISTRFPAELRERLLQAKAKSGRSLSEEIAYRLEQSFTEEPRSAAHFGGVKTRAVLFLIARALHHLRIVTGQSWLDHPFTFRHAAEAIAEVMGDFVPDGDPMIPPDDILEFIRPANGEPPAAALDRIRTYPLGRVYGRAALAEFDFAIAGDIPDPLPDTPSPEMTRALLHVASHPSTRRVRRAPHLAEIASVGRQLKFRKGATK